ncbi:SAM-dependent methyltransferase, ribosomal protein L11-like [Desulfonema limicola]|uniref:SAM-dependent methyltransferase, ribosomal protein L11-like n=1 Tax=Desulfonema limicola TaxID=45656 RepID=A0A975GH91_9BACT|nr:50S ribosomal protein L11 methyltransferase [Desulfonema limicola]QTA81044.1 SAM-dependent methyltransferase, ribosomal protein L11-like [Desulfonema limicola]
MISDIDIKNYILEFVKSSCETIPPAKLEKDIAEKFSLKRKQAKSFIKILTDQGLLAYKDIYGRTVIEISFNRAVRVSKHFILIPPGLAFKPEPEDVIIRLMPGASFGVGEHPTTRLSLQAIDRLFSETGFLENCSKIPNLLDIGTGSGILAIAAMKMGIKKGIGTDIDLCAVSEARLNTEINELENHLIIKNTALESLNKKFSLIIANLRFPTLKTMYSQIVFLADTSSALVLSGIKIEELPKLIDIYSKKYFSCQWHKTEKNWAAALFIKNNPAQL